MINDGWVLWANAAAFNEMYDLRFFFKFSSVCCVLNSALYEYLSIFILRLAAGVHISVCLKVGIYLNHELFLFFFKFSLTYCYSLLFVIVLNCIFFRL